MKLSRSLSILLLVLIPSVGGASSFSGHVVGVIDSDIFDVQHERGIERVRLNGIDAPEKGQAFWRQAQQYVEDLAVGQHVIVETTGKDKYERTIGDVFLFDGRHLNKELVKAGLAWWFCRPSSDAELRQLEDDARDAKRGLWLDPNPVPPWVFRKLQRNPVPSESDDDCRSSSPRPIGLSGTAYDIIGNRRSHIYYRVDCPGYDAVSEEHRIPFVSLEAAEQTGYRAAGNCP